MYRLQFLADVSSSEEPRAISASPCVICSAFRSKIDADAIPIHAAIAVVATSVPRINALIFPRLLVMVNRVKADKNGNEY